jgi:Calx-beta domain
MGNNHRHGIIHTVLFILLCIVLAVMASFGTLLRGRAASPSGDTVAPTLGARKTWAGDPGLLTGATGGEGQCIDSGPAKNCDTFSLTVQGNPSDWNGKLIQVQVAWQLGTHDYDLYIHKGDLTGPIAGQGTNSGQPGTNETAYLDPASMGVGLYSVHVAYAVVTPTDIYNGSATVVPGLTPAPASAGLPARFQLHYPQTSLIASGKGVDAGEPSIGANWKTGKSMYISYLTTFRVTFDDTCPANAQSSTWEDKSAPNNADSLDPILFTDHAYNTASPTVGRTFVSELTGQDSLTAYTDDDGDTWVPSQGGGIPSGVDHQSIGAGPYHTPLTGVAYPDAVYYCSQDIVAAAFCARSDNGGLTFGPGVQIYQADVTNCVGIHGHVKVGPDGAVYVPNRSCNNLTTVVVSQDNGVTWTIRNIPGSSTSSSDPAVAIGRGDKVTGGRLYTAFATGDTEAGVAVSDDHGATWKNVYDVGSLVGIKAVAFPAITAGDDDRAAYAFLGSTTSGSPDNRGFAGLWHLYIATTLDGGATWNVSDATPNDPVQRNGIHLGGGSPPHRNLLDFIGIDVDRQGRILVGYADGCTGPACVQGQNTSTGNSYTEMAAIARQSGGPRLFAANDPSAQPTVPGVPYLTVGRDGAAARLTWSEADNGGSAITNYSIFRGTSAGSVSFLASAGTTASFVDNTASANTTYFYRVTATNAVGTSCSSNEVKSQPVGESQCGGLQIAIDATGDQKGAPANADLDVTEVRLADNVIGGKEKVSFKLSVANLSTLTPNRQWRVIWNYPIPPNQTTPFTGSYYAGMNTDGSGGTSFEYGTVTTVEAVPANSSTPNKIGAADVESNVDQASGTITIVVAADKIGTPKVNDIIGSIVGRTFAGNGNQTLLSSSATDTTSSTGAQDPFTGKSYRLVGNAVCSAPPTPTPTPSPSPTPTPTPTPSPSPTPVAVFQFNSSLYTAQEGVIAVNVTVLRTGVTTSTASVDVVSADATAKQKGDYTFLIAHLVFAPNETQKTVQALISDDSYAEGPESATLLLQNPSNGTLGTPSAATLQILDNSPEATSNPIDISRTFVGQHYHDFLYRQSDQAGEDFWTNIIEQCAADAECRRVKRVAVSSAFFLSIEFRQTGYLVIRSHKAAFGNNKGTPRYDTFLRDQREVGNGVIVGQGNWQAQLDANKQAFLQDFVTRSEFTSKPSFAQGVAAGTYVDALFSNSGVTPTAAERNAAISAYASGDTAGRTNALQSVIESGSVFNKLYNDSFVLMQYFGYLRRNPDSLPDTDFVGYDFWLGKLNGVSQPNEDMRDDGQAQHRAERAEMIRAFIESTEYRERFGDRPSGNQFAERDEGSVARWLKTVVRFAFFGEAG